MIRLKNVSKLYHPNIVGVDEVSLHIRPGEFVSIVGQSGTGKSTLAKLLFAEERPSRGKIEIGGWDITDIRDRDIPTLRRQIGVVFQDFKLLQKKTVYENIAFALQVAGVTPSRIRDVVPRVLSIVNLDEKLHRYPKQLSGGEQQRVAIARALVHSPKVLVADEPTGNLDSATSVQIMALFQELYEQGKTVILVTHEPDIADYAKANIVLKDGRILSIEEDRR